MIVGKALFLLTQLDLFMFFSKPRQRKSLKLDTSIDNLFDSISVKVSPELFTTFLAPFFDLHVRNIKLDFLILNFFLDGLKIEIEAPLFRVRVVKWKAQTNHFLLVIRAEIQLRII